MYLCHWIPSVSSHFFVFWQMLPSRQTEYYQYTLKTTKNKTKTHKKTQLHIKIINESGSTIVLQIEIKDLSLLDMIIVITPLLMICHRKMNELLLPLCLDEVCFEQKHRSWTSFFDLVVQQSLSAILWSLVVEVGLCQIQSPHPRRQLHVE